MIESLILAHLVRDEDYTRIALPHLKKEYFTTPANQQVYAQIESFVTNYKTTPTIDALLLGIETVGLYAEAHDAAVRTIEDIRHVERVDSHRRQWLIDQTEEFCRRRALYLAISESLQRIDENFDSANTVPELLKDALRVGFNADIGHDYITDVGRRYDLYHPSQTRIPFDIDLLNQITGGGLTPKTMNIVVAGTGVGKSLFLCHVAASTIMQGKRVLYITLEMAEERIAQRIDANLLDLTMDQLQSLSRSAYETAFQQLNQRHRLGQMIIKEFPTGGAHAGHFRALLDDLALKKQFHPDLLIVDYVNICASSRFKQSSQVNSYTYVKSIAEELRGVAVQYNVPCLTATQFTRGGYDSSDPGLTDTSESFGLPQTADLQLAIVATEELDRAGKLMFKQLKNRYADPNRHRRFTVRVLRGKMRLMNDTEQEYLSDPIAPTPMPPVQIDKPNPLHRSRLGGFSSGNGDSSIII
jgi:replicative DNA helicase